MSRKIIPPVSPKIVRENPRQRLFRLGLLIFTLLLTAWFAFDYGRSVQPATVNGDVGVVPSGESAQRVAQLEQERDELKQQVSDLQESMRQANQALGASQARIQTLQQTPSSPGEVSSVATAAPAADEPEKPAPLPVDYALQLEGMDIEPTDSVNIFRLHFFVHQAANTTERVTGNIWIAVNGMVNGKPKRLSLKAISAQKHPYVKMAFDQQQDVTEDVVLPDDFVPKNVLIEAKPYGDTFKAVSRKFNWEYGG